MDAQAQIDPNHPVAQKLATLQPKHLDQLRDMMNRAADHFEEAADQYTLTPPGGTAGSLPPWAATLLQSLVTTFGPMALTLLEQLLAKLNPTPAPTPAPPAPAPTPARG